MAEKVRMIIRRGATAFPFSKNTSRLPSTLGPTVSTEIADVACGSNIQRRGRSNAASVPSDVPEANKGQKKVSKAERQAMVESFVNNYRAMNGGKFPSVTDTRKQVGGSHYFLRQIVQELQYKSKLSPLDSGSEQLSVKQLTEDNESLTEVEDLLGSRLIVSSEIHISNELESGNDSIKNLEESQSSASAEKSLPKELVQPLIEDDHTGFLATKSEVLEEEAKVVSDPILEKTEDDKKMEARGGSGCAAPKENILKGETEEFPSLEKSEEDHSHNFEDTDYKLKETPVSEVLLYVEETKKKDVPEPEKYTGFLATKREVLEEEAKVVSDPILEKTEDDKKMEARGDFGCAAPGKNILKGETEEFPSLEKSEEAHNRKLEDTEYKLKETPVSEVLLDVEETKKKDVPEPEKYSMDTRRRQSDAKVANKSSLWGNLKSFADSIISIWRK